MSNATQEKLNIPAWISLEEASQVLNLSIKTLKEHCRLGKLIFKIDKQGKKHNYFIYSASLPQFAKDKLSSDVNDEQQTYSNIAGRRISMKQILIINSCLSDNFLSGKNEVECYNSGEYEKIFNSVKAKVTGFSHIIEKIINNNLETEFPINYMPKHYSKEKQEALKEVAEYRELFFKNRRNLISQLKEEEEKKHYHQKLYTNYEPEIWFFSFSHPWISLFANMGNFFK